MTKKFKGMEKHMRSHHGHPTLYSHQEYQIPRLEKYHTSYDATAASENAKPSDAGEGGNKSNLPPEVDQLSLYKRHNKWVCRYDGTVRSSKSDLHEHLHKLHFNMENGDVPCPIGGDNFVCVCKTTFNCRQSFILHTGRCATNLEVVRLATRSATNLEDERLGTIRSATNLEVERLGTNKSATNLEVEWLGTIRSATNLEVASPEEF